MNEDPTKIPIKIRSRKAQIANLVYQLLAVPNSQNNENKDNKKKTNIK